MKKSFKKLISLTLLAFSFTLGNFSMPAKADSVESNLYEEYNDAKDTSEKDLQEITAISDINTSSYINENQNLQLNLTNSQKKNNYPIVLVHGFLGYGRNEALGIKYWGGLNDYEKKLRADGHETYTAVVGPISSNWDRACELYAYIVGGTVDYGAAHSAKFGHARYGRIYPGLYKNISNENKIHLLGHSMGGQTIRAFTQLLSTGSKEEMEYGQQNISPLFTGGKHWVCSVTTIATPNDGTTLADSSIALNGANSLVGLLGILSGSNNITKSAMDFKLDQWGLTKKSNESYEEYNKRILNSDIWQKTKDIAPYDLTTYGSKELNQWAKAQPDVYYFSWSTKATKKSLFTGHQIPNLNEMNPIFYATGLRIGQYTRNESNKPIIDKSWWPNDGVVNTISENGPKLGSSDIIRTYYGTAVKGQWNAMPTTLNMDHEKAVGFFEDMEQWYIDYAKFLGCLDK